MKSRFTRATALLLTVLLLTLSLLTLASCAKRKTATVYFENGDEVKTFTVNLADYDEGATLYDVLKKDADLQAEMDETSTPFVTAMCGVTPDAAAYEYIAIYVTLADKAWGEDTFEKHGATFYTAGVGVAELPLVEGASYLFRIESWS